MPEFLSACLCAFGIGVCTRIGLPMHCPRVFVVAYIFRQWRLAQVRPRHFVVAKELQTIELPLGTVVMSDISPRPPASKRKRESVIVGSGPH